MSPEKTQHKVQMLEQYTGATDQEIKDEPDWSKVHNKHRVGFKTRDYRYAGLVNEVDEEEIEADRREGQAERDRSAELKEEVQEGKLISIRDVVKSEKVLFIHLYAMFLYVSYCSFTNINSRIFIWHIHRGTI